MNDGSGKKRYRLGVDVGGTHTDLVLKDEQTGSILIEKVSSSPENPALAVLAGVDRFLDRGVSPEEIYFFSHGTTVTTNALLEGKGAKVGLLINSGYRAVCEVQTQARDEGNPYDHLFKRPEHLTPPDLTKEIPCRIDFEGCELTPLDVSSVQEAARSLAGRGVNSFAVCYLFSFMNDAHERETARIIRKIIPDAKVSLSSQVLPRIREWPRYSTTIINAYLVEVLSDYIKTLAEGLDRKLIDTPRRFLMQSNGGVMPLAANAESQTVHTLLSGPAAGVQATAWLIGKSMEIGNIVTLDMGGTSADIAFIQHGVPLEHAEAYVAERIVAVPALDVSTISAGGGSIARINSAGLLEVGPQSAGAEPGPVCYGKGGKEPTVTDADLVCGFLNPDFFLGGRTRLDTEAARQSISDRVAVPMGADLETAAMGIIRVVNARMADEIRVQAAKKGVDLKDFTLVPFGGAGPVHEALVARDLGIQRVLIPASPGAFSAFGLLCADVIHDYIRSDLDDLGELLPHEMEATFRDLEKTASLDLEKEGLGNSSVRFYREVDLRYAGQGYELRVDLEGLGPPLTKGVLPKLTERFHERHEAVHGHAAREAEIELVSYRVRAVVEEPKLELMPRKHDLVVEQIDLQTRSAIFGATGSVSANVYRRETLVPGRKIAGPAIIEQLDSTTVVPPDWNMEVDVFGNLILREDKV
ncbi:MAG: hydantoinase/oxoprolinase family protein [Rhodospirillaceae bacterium]